MGVTTTDAEKEKKKIWTPLELNVYLGRNGRKKHVCG